ncbi:MAG: asparagine synthetase A [Candidatus Micrarchaeia archaeon]
MKKLDERKKAYAKLTSRVLLYTTHFFHNRGFMQLMPVILSPITDPLGPDPNSTVIKRGEIEYLGRTLCLTQSMILHKQLLMHAGVDKLFVISPNVRLEHPSRRASGKHLYEFSQVDFEMRKAKKEEVFALMEDFLVGAVAHVKATCSEDLEFLGRKLPSVRGPFPVYTTHELADKYGADWEDTASLSTKQPFWAVCHTREFYDKEDPAEPGHFLNYDLIYPEGFGEALSGAEREHEYATITKKIEKNGLDKSRYAAYLELAKNDLTPSAGGGFGFERLVRYLSGAPHVGDVQMFRRVPGEEAAV